MARKIVDALEYNAVRTNTDPALSRAFFEFSLKPNFYSNRRSLEELGATYRPIEESIRDAVAYFREVGYVE